MVTAVSKTGTDKPSNFCVKFKRLLSALPSVEMVWLAVCTRKCHAQGVIVIQAEDVELNKLGCGLQIPHF